jgi:hypothetical protein
MFCCYFISFETLIYALAGLNMIDLSIYSRGSADGEKKLSHAPDYPMPQLPRRLGGC